MAATTGETNLVSDQSLPHEPPFWKKYLLNLDNICLVVATVFLICVFIISALSSVPDANKFGFANSTAQISNDFYLQVTPANWTFSIWGVIFAWQALWVLYAWSFVFRPSTPRTVSWISLLLYTCANVNTIIWLYVWGNSRTDISFAFVFLSWAFLLAAIGVETYHLYNLAPNMQGSLAKYKIDLWISRLVVPNGLVIYTTWVTVATLLNFGIVLQYHASVSAITTGAVILWLLSVIVVGYFALENTILDRFARFIFVVYLVLIWALSGVLSAHWGQEDTNTNPVLALLLLLLVIVLFIARVSMIITFAFLRPLYISQALALPANNNNNN